VDEVTENERGVREFDFTRTDFEQVKRLIYDHAGINLSDSKMDMVYSRLGRRLRARGLTTFRDYLDLVASGDGEEWEAFVNSLTTNLTDFFRESHHFPVLADHLRAVRSRQPLNVWCSASSTGEEPYSLAMTAVEAFGTTAPPVRILATDIDTNVLEKARHGVYPLERLAKVSAERQKKFFLMGTGKNAGYARVKDFLRQMITFRQLNLLDDAWPIRGPLEAIFCRNVMIYFDKQTQRKILEKFLPLMRSDALLFMGHSEGLHHVADLFKINGRTVYSIVAAAQKNSFDRNTR
jgi:chemotaxis protein methyltransferase CheR